MLAYHTPPRTYPHPRRAIGCCPLLDHIGLLGDLEHDALTDPDIAHLLPRATRLLTSQGREPAVGPWWTK